MNNMHTDNGSRTGKGKKVCKYDNAEAYKGNIVYCYCKKLGSAPGKFRPVTFARVDEMCPLRQGKK